MFLIANTTLRPSQDGNAPRSPEAGDTDRPHARIAVAARHVNTLVVLKAVIWVQNQNDYLHLMSGACKFGMLKSVAVDNLL